MTIPFFPNVSWHVLQNSTLFWLIHLTNRYMFLEGLLCTNPCAWHQEPKDEKPNFYQLLRLLGSRGEIVMQWRCSYLGPLSPSLPVFSSSARPAKLELPNFPHAIGLLFFPLYKLFPSSSINPHLLVTCMLMTTSMIFSSSDLTPDLSFHLSPSHCQLSAHRHNMAEVKSFLKLFLPLYSL